MKGFKHEKGLAFIRPGYESKTYQLQSHDLMQLINIDAFAARIDAIPRIQKAAVLHPTQKLIDLEQQAMVDFNNSQAVGPETCSGWLHEWWWMTALPQQRNRFREQTYDTITIYAAYYQGQITFCRSDKENEEQPETEVLGIHPYPVDDNMKQRIWLSRTYTALLRQYVSDVDTEDEEKELKKRESVGK